MATRSIIFFKDTDLKPVLVRDDEGYVEEDLKTILNRDDPKVFDLISSRDWLFFYPNCDDDEIDEYKNDDTESFAFIGAAYDPNKRDHRCDDVDIDELRKGMKEFVWITHIHEVSKNEDGSYSVRTDEHPFVV